MTHTMLDLNDPRHVEALRWACENFAVITNEMRVTNWQALALVTLADPSASAALIRALLERYGVEVTAYEHHGKAPWMVWPSPFRAAVCVSERLGSDNELSMQQVAALLLAILNATDEATALTTLREAGR